MSFVYKNLMSVVPIGGVSTLTGNSGGAVGATAGNINVLGGTGITVVGNPGTSTLTISNSGVTNINYTGVTHAQSPYTVLVTDDYISCDTGGGVITIMLPNAPATGKVYTIKDRLGNSNISAITVTTVGGIVTIDRSTSYIINADYESINIIFSGSAYEVW